MGERPTFKDRDQSNGGLPPVQEKGRRRFSNMYSFLGMTAAGLLACVVGGGIVLTNAAHGHVISSEAAAVAVGSVVVGSFMAGSYLGGYYLRWPSFKP